jgi:polyphosphate glucokinase
MAAGPGAHRRDRWHRGTRARHGCSTRAWPLEAAAWLLDARPRRAILPPMSDTVVTPAGETAAAASPAPVASADPMAGGAADPLVDRADEPAHGHRRAIGIDVGGTGVKAAVVDLATGELVSPRIREKTPQPSTPKAVIETIAGILDRLAEGGHLDPAMSAGAGLPGVVKRGRLMTAANIDKGWLDEPAEQALAERLGRPVRLVNDADAAGLAEVAFGAAHGVPGTVLLLTIGTGIGSALLVDGKLLDSTEFGHVPYRRKDAELWVSGAARERRGIGWRRWTGEFNEYLAMLEAWFWPDLIILGGGVSKEYAKYSKWLKSRAPIVTARFLNTAGIIGAALAAGGEAEAVID